MGKINAITRRQFVASSSTMALAGSVLAAGGASAAEKAPQLAIDGGKKAVTAQCAAQLRWGEPEHRQLEEMLKQQSLFYWQGPQTRLLLDRFRSICPVKYAHSCSSGTAALHIAVNAAGIGPGDEVITSPVTDMGTVIGVLYQQAVPVFADLGLGPTTWT